MKIRDATPWLIGSTLKVKIERPTILFGLVQRGKELQLDIPIDSVRAIGISFGSKTEFVTATASEIIPEALGRSVKAFGIVVDTVVALVSGTVSAKDLGGPVLIFQMTTMSAEHGLAALLSMSAFISINLFIFNLLPIPVLDGGQLVVNSLEAIRRKPLNEKFLEYFQMAGLVLVVGLMIFVTWNDVARWVTSIKP